jgi:hypothetical protein
LTRDELAVHAGLYHSVEHDMPVRFAVVGDTLTINGLEMTPTGPHTFVAGSANTRFTFDRIADGHAGRVSFTTARINRQYVAMVPADPSVEQLAEYAGNYYSPELDVTVPVTVQRDRLHIRIGPQPAAPTAPTFKDGFAWSRGWHFTFTRDTDGKVDGFLTTNAIGRCRRVKFERR